MNIFIIDLSFRALNERGLISFSNVWKCLCVSESYVKDQQHSILNVENAILAARDAVTDT
jgi:hypothetical protein